MQTQKIQITLTPEEVSALSFKSRSLGYNVTKYVKFIVMKEASSIVENYPVFSMSQTLEKRTIDALNLHEKGRSKKLKSLNDLNL